MNFIIPKQSVLCHIYNMLNTMNFSVYSYIIKMIYWKTKESETL